MKYNGGFLELLTLLLVGLKLTGLITWSWWTVLAPLWIPWAIAVTILVLTGLFIGGAFIAMSVYYGCEYIYNSVRNKW